MRRSSREVVFALLIGIGTGLAGCDVPRADTPVAGSPVTASSRKLPRLLDLGAGKCIPCKAMAPILEELKVEYAGRMEVQFIDVWKDPDAAKAFGVRIIPTQIFYGPDGTEMARHQGFMDRDAILAQWKALGVGL